MSFPKRPESDPDSSSDPSDLRLQQFLRQHAPTPPAASPDLEARVMASAQMANTQATPRFEGLPTRRTSRLALAAFITVTVTGVYGAIRLLTPTPPTAVELAQIQSFVEVNWNGVLESGGETNGFWDHEP
jgi:hypothetical protein